MNKNSTRRAFAPWLFAASVLPLLGGCFGAAVVGAGAGALMLVDRRPADTQVADQAIEVRAGKRIGEKLGDRAHVNVTSYDRTVLLTGEVPEAATRAEVEKIVSGVPNVKAITDELQVAGASSFASRSNDAYITSKVKARFVDANRFPPTVVKVVTEDGVVYLLGLATQREADAAVEIARTTGGVKRVVRAFEYISEEQARQMDSMPGQQSGDKKSAEAARH